jgi:pimeloyl-ACP methyl ester carboxylesterase
MSSNDVSVVLVHGAWADGSSWAKIIQPLAADGVQVRAAPLPLTSFDDDVAALDRTLERVTGPVVLAGHAYAGAVIAATRNERRSRTSSTAASRIQRRPSSRPTITD